MNFHNRPRSDRAFAEVLYEWEVFNDPIHAHNTILFHLAFLNDPEADMSYEDGYLLDENEKTPYVESVLSDYKEIITARTNLLPRMDSNYSFLKVDGAGLHNDHGFDFEYTTIIYYINTTNGGTCFQDGEVVQSKANRLVIFNGHTLHRQIYQTDEKIRVATNINIIV